MKQKNVLITALLVVTAIVHAQEKVNAVLQPEFWQIQAENHEFKEHDGKQAMYLDNGRARLKEVHFKNGIIEYDVKFPQKRSFIGVHFRIQDPLNYEEYYLRPHQSGNPDAMQYTPVINGNAGWQLFSGEGHWAVFTHRFDQWMHVKLIISGTKMDVFIDDMETPILHVSELKLAPQAGLIGFGTFLGPAYYANLSYQEIETPTLVTKDSPTPGLPEGIITAWKVSQAFAADKLEAIPSLETVAAGTTQTLHTDASGILNLSQVSVISDSTNAVLASFSIDAESDRMQKLDFGYSDATIVFVNGKPVYSGNNGFRSRDYRYLGSLGFFDSIYLDLKEGTNEITFAVQERFGGWGIMARLVE